LSRRAILAVIAILALLGGGRLISRSIHPALAAHDNVAPSVSPDDLGLSSVAAASAGKSPEPAKPEPRAAAAQATGGLTDVDPHKAFGSKNAPIAMEIFSDFQCPACKLLFINVNQKLIDNYVNSGKVYLIHRDFPLPMHAYSRAAARYARAAAQLGRAEPVEQVLFDNQEKWEQNGDVDGTVARVVSPAEMVKIRALVKGPTLDPLIDKDYALGQGYRVNQTPTTIIHSRGQTFPVVGQVSYDVLKSFLDQLLSQ
jgi:protein-disulfide isomerase